MKQNFSLLKPLNMKNKNNHLLVIALFSFYFSAFSQKIESVTYKDKPCYVYPFEIQVKINETYFSAINFKKHKKIFLQMLEDSQWKNLTSTEYLMATYNFKRDLKRYKKLYKNNKGKKGGQLIRAIRENPYPLLEQRYERDEDIKPCLDIIPDGTYIQYFEDFPLITSKNEIIVVKDRVAGIFNIKNNVLEGEAVWFNFKGDTLKKGVFKNGLKEGEWFFEKRTVENRLNKETKEQYIKKGIPFIDTVVEVMMYSKGVRNGYYYQKGNTDNNVYEGFYIENEFSGHWKERIMRLPSNIFMPAAVKEAKENLRHNTVVTAEYTYVKEKTTVKQPIIRDGLIMEYYVKDYNFDYNYLPIDPNKGLYKVAFEEEVDLELEEEKINSYEGSVYSDEYEDEYYEESEYYRESEYYDYSEEEISKFQSLVYDRKTGNRLFRGKAIDSIGVIFNYEGIYEKRYPNGQLMFRYEFKDGKLLKEDTIFWDNGTPFDVITYKQDSSQYIQSIYDYDGKLYHELVFNSLGDFVRINFEPNTKEYVVLEGLLAEDKRSVNFYSYDKMDTLSSKLEVDSLLIWKAWIKEDSAQIFRRMYYPKERILKLENFAMSGKSSWQSEIIFGEDFQNWTGVETYSFKNLVAKSNNSASYVKYRYPNKRLDSIPQLNVNEYDNNYNITTDNVLYKDNIPYSGDVSIKINGNRAKYNTKKELDITLPVSMYMTKKLRNDYERYKKKGKTKYPEYLNSVCIDEISSDFSGDIFNYLFPFLEGDIVYPEIYLDYNEKGSIEKYKEKKFDSSAKKITGHMKDGKPDGIWTVEDQFGDIKIIMPYKDGMKNGTVKIYDVAEPINYFEDEYYYEEEMSYLYDTFPKKKTYYLSWEDNYKNGIPHGESIQYNWLGGVIQYEKYVDGFRQGEAYERNNLAYTHMTYMDDALDGYLQTYLTIKGRDTILLYDLNFQNGELQGESKSYHTNGKLSKRGFFLNGQPIDDYEAYDSLGIKYHYVKFLYSFPVEEKIWEENELSVLYTFDWRDSIYFIPSDITSSQSLDRMLSDLGIGMDMFEQPYYGRPSLVEKTGIDYHMTKYYPNDTVAREGEISAGKKVGCWNYYSYEGEKLYEVDYFDTIIKLNDSIQFKAKGLLTDFNAKGKEISKSFIIEKFEKYDCSHTDHYEIRQLYTIWQAHDSLKCMNGYVKNHYDNGVLQNEGNMVNGLPTGVWKFYDPFGKLNQVGVYVMGKRDGRWLAGDLSKTKYLGDICLNPNLPDLEEEIKTREQQLDIIITNYKLGKALNKEFYDIDWSEFNDKKELENEDE